MEQILSCRGRESRCWIYACCGHVFAFDCWHWTDCIHSCVSFQCRFGKSNMDVLRTQLSWLYVRSFSFLESTS